MAITAKSYTGGLTAAQVITAVPGVTYSGFTVNANNSGGVSTITVFDNATVATGTILHQVTIPVQAVANTQIFTLHTSVRAVNGLTISVVTTAVGDITFWVN